MSERRRKSRRPRLGLAARLYVAIGGAVAFTLIASVVAWISFVALGAQQQTVTRTHLPAITLSLHTAKQSALIAAAAPRLLTVTDERERQQAIRDLEGLEQELTRLLNALGETLARSTGETEVLAVVRATSQQLSTSLISLGQSVGLQLALEEQLAQQVAAAVKSHRRLGKLIAPWIDDATFYLVTGYSSLDDAAPVPLDQRVNETVLLHFAALGDLAAEANLMIGLLTEASVTLDASLLRPLRERFEAAADRFDAALRSLSVLPQATAIHAAFEELVGLGRGEQGIIDLRRRALEHRLAAQKLVEQNRRLAANLTQDVERIVQEAQSGTLASVSATNEAIEFGRQSLLLLNGVAILGAIAIGWIYVKRSFTDPMLRLTAAAEQFERERFEAATLEATSKRSDELGHLARTFTRMAEEVQARTDTLDRLVAERTKQLHEKNAALEQSLKQIADELAMAQRMQLFILPHRMPELDRLALFASMQAARSVGGDFYDIIELDRNRVGIVIADVSDKGVPAALLMAVCCTHIKSIAMRGVPPGQMMEELNSTLSDENDTAMFVTAFYGVVDLTEGTLTYANAGHDAPLLLRDQKPAEPLPRTGGIALGVVPGADYEEASIALRPGDTVFFYTDGVTEAFNAEGDAFSALRLKEVLYRASSLSVESLCRRVIEDVESYTEGAPQSDDITCVVIRYRADRETPMEGEEEEAKVPELVFSLKADFAELPRLAEGVEGFVEENDLPPKLAFQLNLVLDELLSNMIKHGCTNDRECHIEVRLMREDEAVVLMIEDNALHFNPLDTPPPDLDTSLEERPIGGLGIHLVRTTMDRIDYKRDGEVNRLTMRKKLNG